MKFLGESDYAIRGLLALLVLCWSVPCARTVGTAQAGCGLVDCPEGGPQERATTIPFSMEDEAILHARCHVACANEAVRNDPIWPFLSTSDLGSNCIRLREIEDCKRGCLVRAKKPNLTKNECRNDCKDLCISTCPSEGACIYNGTICTKNCMSSRPSCKDGCILYLSTIEDTTLTSLPPLPSPLAPPSLTGLQTNGRLTWSPGLYDIDYSHSNGTVSVQNPSNLTAFIIRVSQPQTTSYFFQMTLNQETLDLSYFSCQDVNVSFAAISSDRMSSYSPINEICVHSGRQYPTQPTNDSLGFTWSIDDRAGYEGHVVVNITWERPQNYYFIDHYTIQIFSQGGDCGAADTVYEEFNNIPSTSDIFIYAARDQDHAPFVNCRYTYTLQALPATNEHDYAFGVIDIPNELPARLVLSCSSHLNGTTGRQTAFVSWQIDGFDANPAIESIGSYTIVVKKVEPRGPGHVPRVTFIVESAEIQPEENSYEVSNIEPDKTSQIRIEVEPIIHPNVTYIQLPDKRECILEALTSPPGPINENTITVNQFSLEPLPDSDRQSVLLVNLTWEPPQRPYGKITNYQVRILHKPEQPGQDITHSMELAKTLESKKIVPGQLINDSVYKTMEICLYGQIRAENRYGWGNWSKSIVLERYPEVYPNCTITSVTDHTNTADPISNGKTRINYPLYVGIGASVGAICFIVTCSILTFVCVHLCKRYRMKLQMRRVFDKSGYPNPMFAAGGVGALHRRNSSTRYPHTHINNSGPMTDEWEIPVSTVIIETKFGEGCFGEVHKGIVRGPIPTSRSMKSAICVAVAIKTLKSSATGSERTDFLGEIETMKKVAMGNNPHVITFVGCVTIQEPLCLITEFVKHGDLLSYLETIRKMITHKNRQKKLARIAGLKEPEPYLVPTPKQLEASAVAVEGGVADVDDEMGMGGADKGVVPAPGSVYADLGEVEPVNLISFAYQIASGMDYLSSLDVVHRDLACRNILIGENKNLKISDFGMSRVVSGEDIYVKTTKGRLPWKWMAIESITNREFTYQSDVWAYGVTLWEIATLGGFPYPMIGNIELLDYLKGGYRLECPDNCCTEIYKVMLDCWSENPNDRPTFPDLRSKFDAMLAEDNPYIQFDNINSQKPYYNRLLSRRNSRCNEDQSTTNIILSSEISSSSSSSLTLSTPTSNGASASSGVYDLLKPIIPSIEVPAVANLDDNPQGHLMANPYVDTPTTKLSFRVGPEGMESTGTTVVSVTIEEPFENVDRSLEDSSEFNAEAQMERNGHVDDVTCET